MPQNELMAVACPPLLLGPDSKECRLRWHQEEHPSRLAFLGRKVLLVCMPVEDGSGCIAQRCEWPNSSQYGSNLLTINGAATPLPARPSNPAASANLLDISATLRHGFNEVLLMRSSPTAGAKRRSFLLLACMMRSLPTPRSLAVSCINLRTAPLQLSVTLLKAQFELMRRPGGCWLGMRSASFNAVSRKLAVIKEYETYKAHYLKKKQAEMLLVEQLQAQLQGMAGAAAAGGAAATSASVPAAAAAAAPSTVSAADYAESRAVQAMWRSSKYSSAETATTEVSDEVEVGSQTVSLQDPLTKAVLQIPCRGLECAHMSCMDLLSYLSLNSNPLTARWKCPLCKAYLMPSSLWIDSFYLALLRCAASGKRKGTEQDLQNAMGAAAEMEEQVRLVLQNFVPAPLGMQPLITTLPRAEEGRYAEEALTADGSSLLRDLCRVDGAPTAAMVSGYTDISAAARAAGTPDAKAVYGLYKCSLDWKVQGIPKVVLHPDLSWEVVADPSAGAVSLEPAVQVVRSEPRAGGAAGGAAAGGGGGGVFSSPSAASSHPISIDILDSTPEEDRAFSSAQLSGKKRAYHKMLADAIASAEDEAAAGAAAGGNGLARAVAQAAARGAFVSLVDDD